MSPDQEGLTAQVGERLSAPLASALFARGLAFAFVIHSALPDFEQREWSGAWGGQRALTLTLALALMVCALTPAEHPLAQLTQAQRQALMSFATGERWRVRLSSFASRLAPLLALSLASLKLTHLLTLRDVLTQSALLMCLSLSVALALWWSQRGREGRAWWAITLGARLGALTYAAAALHKLNSAFLFSPQSCALHGVELTAELIGLPWSASLPTLGLWWLDQPLQRLNELAHSPLISGGLIIAVELTLALLLWRGARSGLRWAWALGALFHLPLTLTIAPAFGLVMGVSYLAAPLSASREASLSPLASKLIRLSRPLPLGAFALLMGYSPLSLWLKGALFVGVLYVAAQKESVGEPQSALEPLTEPLSPPPLAVTLLWSLYALHSLSPYLGFEVQHSGAMLSNLRVDPACHNSLIAPSWGWDPYLRIEEARLGQASRPQQLQALTSQLWGWAAINTLKRNWCSPQTRPFELKGSWWGEPFELLDLCAPHSLEPLKALHPWSTAAPVGWQRLQKNLSRRCDQACVH